MRPWPRTKVAILSVAMVAMIVLSSCDGEAPVAEDRNDAISAAAIPTVAIRVRVATLQKAELANPIVADGTIAAKQTSNIGALAEGVVERIFVAVGARVNKGDPLFQTRMSDYQRRLKEVEAARDVALAELENARLLVERRRPLTTKGVVSGAQFDEAKTGFDVARARVALQEARVETARQALADTTVRAPFDGAVTARFIDEGVYMTNRFSGGGNAAVLQIQECESATAILFAPESHISQLRVGLKGQLFVDGRAQPISSEVRVINDRIDATARTMEIRMPFANPGCAVRAGQSVRAEIQAPPRSVLTLSRISVQGAGSDRYVFVVQGGQARRKAISVRDVDTLRVEVLEGITPDSRVVEKASGTLVDGSRVEVEEL